MTSLPANPAELERRARYLLNVAAFITNAEKYDEVLKAQELRDEAEGLREQSRKGAKNTNSGSYIRPQAQWALAFGQGYLRRNSVVFMAPSQGLQSGVLPRSKNHLEWWQRRKLRSPLYRWYLVSPLQPLVCEICKFPHRIAFAANRPPKTVGIPTPCPQEFEKLGQREQFLRASTLGIGQLVSRYRWWGHLDTLVAVEAFRLGAVFGVRSERTCIRRTSQRDQTP